MARLHQVLFAGLLARALAPLLATVRLALLKRAMYWQLRLVAVRKAHAKKQASVKLHTRYLDRYTKTTLQQQPGLPEVYRKHIPGLGHVPILGRMEEGVVEDQQLRIRVVPSLSRHR